RSETESFFEEEKERQLAALPGVLHAGNGEPLASGQAILLQILKRADGGETNVSLRGVQPAIFLIRPQIHMIEGRRFEPGKGEVIVGKNLAARYSALRLGQEVRFGRIPFKVVGVFDAGGASFDSEVWGAVEDLSNAFRRNTVYSSAVLHASSPEAARNLIKTIEAD